METFKQGQTSDIPATIYGGKAANLSELVNAGFNVPPGFVYSPEEIYPLFGFGMPEDRPSQTAMLERHVEEICGGFPVAVRSSAIGEDGDGFSFAGQYDTVLNIFTAADVMRAIGAVAASANKDRVESYKEANNLEASLEAGVGVIVQAMVRPASAGVMFTAEPVESDPSLIAIESVQGLGDKMVSGQASPDFHLLDKFTGVTVESTCINDPVLGRTEINALYEAGVAIESHYGCPQDIEWAFGLDSNGERGLFILQARPITTL